MLSIAVTSLVRGVCWRRWSIAWNAASSGRPGNEMSEGMVSNVGVVLAGLGWWSQICA